MIIFVTTTKPFKSIFKNIQKNAINSWVELNVDKKILVLTEEQTCIDFCNDKKIMSVTEYEKSDITGIPTYRSLIESAKKVATDNDIICQINSDIILCDDFVETISSFIKNHEYRKFALVGQRFDCDFDNSLIDFSIDWKNHLPDGEWHPSCGVDYFVFSKNTFDDLPKFFVARFNYDGWLLGFLNSNNIPIFNCSGTIKPYHQNHGYGEFGNLKQEEFVNKYIQEISHNNSFSHSMNIDRIFGCSFRDENGKILFKL